MVVKFDFVTHEAVLLVRSGQKYKYLKKEKIF